MKGKSKAPVAKGSKTTLARKNAEAQKAKKKAERMSKGNDLMFAAKGKGKSAVGQSKTAKKK